MKLATNIVWPLRTIQSGELTFDWPGDSKAGARHMVDSAYWRAFGFWHDWGIEEGTLTSTGPTGSVRTAPMPELRSSLEINERLHDHPRTNRSRTRILLGLELFAERPGCGLNGLLGLHSSASNGNDGNFKPPAGLRPNDTRH